VEDAAPIRVAIVDDQAMVRAGFGALLNAQEGITVVGDASDGGAAPELVARTRPDVVLMDIRMPGVDGIEATRRIAALDGVDPRIIILTTFDLDAYVCGFLLKDAPADDLVHAIRVVAGGDALLSPSITRSVIAEFVSQPERSASDTARFGDLTERELDVAKLVARGLSNAEIARELVLADQTVKTHVSRVLMKLGLRDRTQIVVAAYESGLITVGS
jgi:DNA-binding NarL/FixJ family response regulator